MSRLSALALALLAALALTAATRPPSTIFDLSDVLGKRAPAIALASADGAPVALTADGRPTYVFLFAGWCGPCMESLPFVRNAYAKYGDRVRFVGVDVLEDADAARAAVANAALPFPVAIFSIDELDAAIPVDAQRRAGAKYRIPADYLIDANGVVRFAWHGLALTSDHDPVDVLPGYLAKLGIE